jgi:hypothetical protein
MDKVDMEFSPSRETMSPEQWAFCILLLDNVGYVAKLPFRMSAQEVVIRVRTVVCVAIQIRR